MTQSYHYLVKNKYFFVHLTLLPVGVRVWPVGFGTKMATNDFSFKIFPRIFGKQNQRNNFAFIL
jgi:hypothetical protein